MHPRCSYQGFERQVDNARMQCRPPYSQYGIRQNCPRIFDRDQVRSIPPHWQNHQMVNILQQPNQPVRNTRVSASEQILDWLDFCPRFPHRQQMHGIWNCRSSRLNQPVYFCPVIPQGQVSQSHPLHGSPPMYRPLRAHPNPSFGVYSMCRQQEQGSLSLVHHDLVHRPRGPSCSRPSLFRQQPLPSFKQSRPSIRHINRPSTSPEKNQLPRQSKSNPVACSSASRQAEDETFDTACHKGENPSDIVTENMDDKTEQENGGSGAKNDTADKSVDSKCENSKLGNAENVTKELFDVTQEIGCNLQMETVKVENEPINTDINKELEAINHASEVTPKARQKEPDLPQLENDCNDTQNVEVGDLEAGRFEENAVSLAQNSKMMCNLSEEDVLSNSGTTNCQAEPNDISFNSCETELENNSQGGIDSEMGIYFMTDNGNIVISEQGATKCLPKLKPLSVNLGPRCDEKSNSASGVTSHMTRVHGHVTRSCGHTKVRRCVTKDWHVTKARLGGNEVNVQKDLEVRLEKLSFSAMEGMHGVCVECPKPDADGDSAKSNSDTHSMKPNFDLERSHVETDSGNRGNSMPSPESKCDTDVDSVKRTLENIPGDIDGYLEEEEKVLREVPEVKKESENIKEEQAEDCFMDDDEDDDELLQAAPMFLREVKEIISRPLPETPEKWKPEGGDWDLSDEGCSPMTFTKCKRPAAATKMSLDSLLAEKLQNLLHVVRSLLQKERDEELMEINTELQKDLKSGGFAEILNKEEATPTDSPLQEEQRAVLQKFHVEESRICDDRPGDVVFRPGQYQTLFDSSLQPAHCGFRGVPGAQMMDKHLENLTADGYQRMLTSGIIQMCFHRVKCQAELLRWMFLLLSVQEDYETRAGCHRTLMEILSAQHSTKPVWCPSLTDILTVFVNYGADLEDLVPSSLVSVDDIRNRFNVQKLPKPSTHTDGDDVYPQENVFLVLEVIAIAAQGHKGCYNGEEATLLLTILCKAALDSAFKHCCANMPFSNCIAMVIQQYSDADWELHRLKACRVLAGLTSHHHNQAHLAGLLPAGHRGVYIQRRVSYLMLHNILGTEQPVSDTELHNIQIQDLHDLIPGLKELLLNDPYRLYSVVSLLDLCVGVTLSLNSGEREDLRRLTDLVKRVQVRDSFALLDRTRVKDMLVRLTCRWHLNVMATKGKQTKIFEYGVYDSPSRMKIEKIEHESEDSEDWEDEEIQR